MPYRYLEDEATADVAFEAWGERLEEVFRASAEATLNVMIEDVDTVVARERVSMELSSDALDFLLFDFLQRVIYYKDAKELLVRVSQVEVRGSGGAWTMQAEGGGEPLDPERHRQIVDVKAVTFHGFRLEERDGQWRAHVVLDI